MSLQGSTHGRIHEISYETSRISEKINVRAAWAMIWLNYGPWMLLLVETPHFPPSMVASSTNWTTLKLWVPQRFQRNTWVGVRKTHPLKHFSTIRCFFDAFRTKENREKKIFSSCGEPRLRLGRVLSTGLWSAALTLKRLRLFLTFCWIRVGLTRQDGIAGRRPA